MLVMHFGRPAPEMHSHYGMALSLLTRQRPRGPASSSLGPSDAHYRRLPSQLDTQVDAVRHSAREGIGYAGAYDGDRDRAVPTFSLHQTRVRTGEARCECSVFARSRLKNAVCGSVVHVVAPPGSEFVRRVTPHPDRFAISPGLGTIPARTGLSSMYRLHASRSRFPPDWIYTVLPTRCRSVSRSY